MKRSKFFSNVFVLILLLITGCASLMEYGKLHDRAKENYQRQNYDEAVSLVAQSLRIKPDYEESQALIKEAFPRAVSSHIDKISELKQNSLKFKWDTIVSEYVALIGLNKAIKSLPVLTDKSTKTIITFDLVDYSQLLSEAKNNAAEDHYLEGKRLASNDHRRSGDEFKIADKYLSGFKDALALGAEGYYQSGLRISKKDDVESQKLAAKEFKIATEFVSGYKDCLDRYEKARKSGIKRIAIIPFQNKSGKDYFGAVADEVVDSIASNVMNDSNATEFLEIISRDQLATVINEQKLSLTGLFDETNAIKMGKLLNVHEILTGSITRINVTPERTTDRTYKDKATLCRDVLAGYDKKGREVYKQVCDVSVSARVTVYSRSAGASVSGSYKIIDVKTAKLKDSKQINEEYKFNHEWAAYSGDERALGNASKNLCSVSEAFAPGEEEMVSNALRRLSDSLTDTFKAYAR